MKRGNASRAKITNIYCIFPVSKRCMNVRNTVCTIHRLPPSTIFLHTGHYTGTVEHRLCYYCDLGEAEDGIHCTVHSTVITEKYYLIEFQHRKACSRIEVLLNLFFDNHIFAISSAANTYESYNTSISKAWNRKLHSTCAQQQALRVDLMNIILPSAPMSRHARSCSLSGLPSLYLYFSLNFHWDHLFGKCIYLLVWKISFASVQCLFCFVSVQ